jgi:tRNA (guanine37-N1)-methyltransferase
MRIDIISAVPNLLDSFFNFSIIANAIKNNIAEVFIHDLHDYSVNKHKKIDDYPYGGSKGMVLTCQPIFDCINKLKSERNYDEIIYTSADGSVYDQKKANSLSLLKNIIILCGHYKGVDQRVRDTLITSEISLGNYVLTGGELAASIIADSVIRLIPGAMGDSESALSDSFMDDLLEGPIYTRPSEFNNQKVPEILLSGNHKLINEWNLKQSVEKTKLKRPDLLSNSK